jgi:hypothetical protein
MPSFNGKKTADNVYPQKRGLRKAAAPFGVFPKVGSNRAMQRLFAEHV